VLDPFADLGELDGRRRQGRNKLHDEDTWPV
jgi:hypothetical protein